MPIVSNRYYNDPNIGQAFSNLAGAFAPPSGSELSGYASAKQNAKRPSDWPTTTTMFKARATTETMLNGARLPLAYIIRRNRSTRWTRAISRRSAART